MALADAKGLLSLAKAAERDTPSGPFELQLSGRGRGKSLISASVILTGWFSLSPPPFLGTICMRDEELLEDDDEVVTFSAFLRHNSARLSAVSEKTWWQCSFRTCSE